MLNKIAFASLSLIASQACAGDMASAFDAWMCLHDHLPIQVVGAADTLKTGELRFHVTNDLEFPISEIAIDTQEASSSGEEFNRIERSVVVRMTPPLEPGHSQDVSAMLDVSKDEVEKLLAGQDFTASASVANALDKHGMRVLVREDLGPSYKAFWPKAEKSSWSCE